MHKTTTFWPCFALNKTARLPQKRKPGWCLYKDTKNVLEIKGETSQPEKFHRRYRKRPACGGHRLSTDELRIIVFIIPIENSFEMIYL